MRKKYISVVLATIVSLTLLAPISANAEQKTTGTTILEAKSYNLRIKSVPNISVTVNQGSKYTMPKTVVATMTDGTKKTYTIKWNTSGINTSRAGTYTSSGTVTGYPRRIVLTAKVIGIASVPDIYASINQGAKYSLPNTVTVTMTDGSKQVKDISWNKSSINTNKAGKYTAIGTISGYPGRVTLELNIVAPKPQPQKPKPPVVIPTTGYTGKYVQQKLYDLGFVNFNGGVILNPYGANGNAEYTYMAFCVHHSVDMDMYLTIYNSTPEVDKKIRTLLGYILPTQSGKLYSILDTPNLKPQTVTLDGRKVRITIQHYGINIAFGPIVK